MGCNETSPAHPQGCSGRKKNEPVACATEIQSAPAQGFSFHWSQPSGCQGSIPIPPVRRMKGTKVLGHGKGWAYTHQSLDGDWLTLGDGSAFCQWAVQGTVWMKERQPTRKMDQFVKRKKQPKGLRQQLTWLLPLADRTRNVRGGGEENRRPWPWGLGLGEESWWEHEEEELKAWLSQTLGAWGS